MGALRPWCCERIMGAERFCRLRAPLVGQARGRVLEIGAGTGLNLAHYPQAVEELVLLEPDTALLKVAQGRSRTSVSVRCVAASATALPFADGAFDTVLSTWTMCTISPLVPALVEMRRVLRPDGRLLYVEHGRAATRFCAGAQDALTPLWRRVAGGCHLNRSIAEHITEAGFRLEAHEEGKLMRGPALFTYHYTGVARPKA